MKQVIFTLEDSEAARLKDRAGSFGLTQAAYLRQVVKDSFKRNSEEGKKVVLDHIKAIVPTLAAAFGIVQNAKPEQIQKLKDELNRIFNDSLKGDIQG